jgi:MFS family permease
MPLMDRRPPHARPGRAFDAPGYRWLWLHALVTSLALTVESLSLGWLILQLTNSSFWVGAGAGVRGATQFLFAIPGGTLVDRVDRRRILLVTRATILIGVMAVALLVLFGKIRLWHIIVYMAVSGLLASVENPGTSSLLYDVVGPERLMNAVALRFMAGSIVRIAGTLAGGVIIDWWGAGSNFFVAAGAHAVGFGSLLLVPRPQTVLRALEPLIHSVKAGLRYAYEHRPVRQLLLLSLTIEGFGFSYLTMLPVMARDILKVGGTGFGNLAAAAAVGQLAATLLIASREDVAQKGRLLITAAFAFGVFVALFGISPVFALSLVLVAIAGASGVTYDSSMSTLMSTSVTDTMRGRVLGLYGSTIALNQLGGFVIGTLAAFLGAPSALVICGGMASAGALALRPGIRSIDQMRQETMGVPQEISGHAP